MLERQIEDLSVYNKPHDQAESIIANGQGRQIRAELLKEQESQTRKDTEALVRSSRPIPIKKKVVVTEPPYKDYG